MFGKAPPIHRLAYNDIEYRLDRWSKDGCGIIEEEVAFISDLYVGRAAFAEAVKRYPDQIWTLRTGARIIEEYPERPRQRVTSAVVDGEAPDPAHLNSMGGA